MVAEFKSGLDVKAVRSDFPILGTQVNGRQLVYLDNGATSQKPRRVIEALDVYWKTVNANVHRGVHHLSQRATSEFDASREKVQRLLNAKFSKEVIFTRGCTESINLMATCLTSSAGSSKVSSDGAPLLKAGDEILISHMEHHSNIVPWQMAAERVGATVKVIPITDAGEIDLDAYKTLLKSGKVKVVGIVHVSNSLGTINPVREMVKMAHEAGALVLVDGAQAGPHLRIDVQDLDADFYTLSCHKIYAPTGVGVLYGKLNLLQQMPPYQGGGDMIRTVSFEQPTTYAGLPAKFEAGTPNIAGVIGLGAAIDYLQQLGTALDPSSPDPLAEAFQWIGSQENDLTSYGTARLLEIPGLRLTGTAKHKAGILSFVLNGVHPHDIGTILDSEGVAIRAGHHCCMPLMKRLGVPATARASLAFYNTRDDLDRLVEAVRKVQETFAA